MPRTDPSSAARALARTLGHWGRRFGPPGFAWERVPPAELLHGRGKVLRAVRYVVLNPCRAGLCADPLEWVMSAYRDLIGAVAEPWCEGASLRASGAGREADELRSELHAWVSGDPSVSVAGTPPPRSSEAGGLARLPVMEVVRAAAAATRGLPGDVRIRGRTQRLFVALAVRHGWRDGRVLAEACQVALRTVQRLRNREPDPSALEAGRLCLGDSRLRSLTGLGLEDEWVASRPTRRRPGGGHCPT